MEKDPPTTNPPRRGEAVNLTITLENVGDFDATDVVGTVMVSNATVTSPPAGVLSIPSIPVGMTAVVTATRTRSTSLPASRWDTPLVKKVRGQRTAPKTRPDKTARPAGRAAPVASSNECSKCGSRDVKCGKSYGCPFVIFVFVSIGLGLLMIPFLPNECECANCGLKWKA